VRYTVILKRDWSPYMLPGPLSHLRKNLSVVCCALASLAFPHLVLGIGEERLAVVEKTTDQSLLAKVAVTDKHPNVREAAVQRLRDQGLLAKIAIEDEVPAVRLAAVKTLTDQGLLAQIAIALKSSKFDLWERDDMDRTVSVVNGTIEYGQFRKNHRRVFRTRDNNAMVCLAAFKAMLDFSNLKRTQGDLDGAIADYKAAIKLIPQIDNHTSAYALGQLVGPPKGYDPLPAYDVAPSFLFAEAHNDLGDAYRAKGALYKAVVEYDTAASVAHSHNSSPSPNYGYAVLFRSYSGSSEAWKLLDNFTAAAAYHAKANEYDEAHGDAKLAADLKAAKESLAREAEGPKSICDDAKLCSYDGERVLCRGHWMICKKTVVPATPR
jgi:hypothetical protein